jgi:hypothetical protein
MKTVSKSPLARLLIAPALLGVAAILLGGCATTNTTAPSTPPSATVRIKEWSAAYYGSAATGQGTLTFNGQQYPFAISALGAGGMGGQKVSAKGKVYNLTNVSDFAGTFTGVSSGLTLIEGSMHAKLTNGNGVVLYLAGETEGLASSLGVQAFQVTLNQ